MVHAGARMGRSWHGGLRLCRNGLTILGCKRRIGLISLDSDNGDGNSAVGDDDGTARLVAERFSRTCTMAYEPKKKGCRRQSRLLSPRQPSAAAIADIRGRVQTASKPLETSSDPLFFPATLAGGGGAVWACHICQRRETKNNKKERRNEERKKGLGFFVPPRLCCRSAVRMAAAGTPQPDASMRRLNPAPASHPGD